MIDHSTVICVYYVLWCCLVPVIVHLHWGTLYFHIWRFSYKLYHSWSVQLIWTSLIIGVQFAFIIIITETWLIIFPKHSQSIVSFNRLNFFVKIMFVLIEFLSLFKIVSFHSRVMQSHAADVSLTAVTLTSHAESWSCCNTNKSCSWCNTQLFLKTQHVSCLCSPL